MAEAEEKKEEAAPAAAPAPATPVAASNSGAKKVGWVITLVLSILVGQLGVDRFMMGQVGMGILKLITAGGCGIWWIIDIILIATKHEFPGIEWVD